MCCTPFTQLQIYLNAKITEFYDKQTLFLSLTHTHTLTYAKSIIIIPHTLSVWAEHVHFMSWFCFWCVCRRLYITTVLHMNNNNNNERALVRSFPIRIYSSLVCSWRLLWWNTYVKVKAPATVWISSSLLSLTWYTVSWNQKLVALRCLSFCWFCTSNSFSSFPPAPSPQQQTSRVKKIYYNATVIS